MLYKLLSQIDRSRFKNLVVSITDRGILGGRLEEMGIRVDTLDMALGVPNPLGLWRLLRLLREERPALLQTWLYHADLLGLLAGKLTRVPFIAWNVRCSNMDMGHYSRVSLAVLRLLTVLSPLPDAVLVNSHSGRSFHEELGYTPKRWKLFHNGFDTFSFRPNRKVRSEFRRRLGVSKDVILIGLVARYDPMKDHKNLIEAAYILLNDHPEVHFVLAGHGVDNSNRSMAQAIARSGSGANFHLLGERDDVPHLMAALDIATSSSCSEGFPNTVGEAMACGVPCVVTDVGDSALLVGNAGKVVPPKDPLSLAAGLRELVGLGEEGRRQLGAAARLRIEKDFSLPAVVARYERFYEEAVTNVRVRRLQK